MHIDYTTCCALLHLTGNKGSIKNKINNYLSDNYIENGNKPTTIFCISVDTEKSLIKNLKKEKFIPLFKFNRKRQYTSEKHTLTFWVKGLNKNTIKLIKK